MAKKNKDQFRPAAPQPTKREMVLAKRQVQVAQGDTIPSIATKNNIPEIDLLSANPGVITVRPGQVVNVPSPSFAGNANNTDHGRRGASGAQGNTGVTPLTELYNVLSQFVPSPQSFSFNQPTSGGSRRPRPTSEPSKGPGLQSPVPVNTPNQYSGTAGYWGEYNAQRFNQGVGVYAPTQANTGQANFQTPTTNGFQAQQQPYLGSSGYLNPAIRPPSSQPTTQVPAYPTNEKGKPIPYTGNPDDPNTALWKNYWNASAKAGVDLAGRTSAPSVMTRDQIWDMKAAQRRRQAASMGETGTSSGTSSSDGSFQYNTYVGSPLVRNITWSIRG